MKKDIEWLKEEVWKQDIVMDKGYIYTDDLMSIINEVDKPEVLSKEWIDKNVVHVRGLGDIVKAEIVENLIVPKQEEIEVKIQELIESYERQYGAHGDLENVWIDGFIKDLERLVEKEPLYHALIKGHELVDSFNIYWNFDKSDCMLFISRLHPPHDNFITKMIKEEWNKLGINDSNADFVEVAE